MCLNVGTWLHRELATGADLCTSTLPLPEGTMLRIKGLSLETGIGEQDGASGEFMQLLGQSDPRQMSPQLSVMDDATASTKLNSPVSKASCQSDFFFLRILKRCCQWQPLMVDSVNCGDVGNRGRGNTRPIFGTRNKAYAGLRTGVD